MCMQYDGDGSTPELVECSPPNDKSCLFSIYGATLKQRCARSELDINRCLIDPNLGPTLFAGCHCNTPMCNVYCAWIDCKNVRNPYSSRKPNSSSMINEMSVDMPWEIPKLCTAKCWPHIL